MTDQDYVILAAMRLYGGSFASALANAALAADTPNFDRLKAAFPDLWLQYAKIAERATKKAQKPKTHERNALMWLISLFLP